MSFEFTVTPSQLRAALAEIEIAEKNGFNYCEAVFKLTSVGENLEDCAAKYSDLWERAHPTEAHLNWGRLQGVTRRNRFCGKTKKLVPFK
jgi:hypothetical protein